MKSRSLTLLVVVVAESIPQIILRNTTELLEIRIRSGYVEPTVVGTVQRLNLLVSPVTVSIGFCLTICAPLPTQYAAFFHQAFSLAHQQINMRVCM